MRISSRPNTYVISGTRQIAGSMGEPEKFTKEITCESSRVAYLTVKNEKGYSHTHIITIKMICHECGEPHLVVPPTLYLQ